MKQPPMVSFEELSIRLRPTFEKYQVLRAIVFGSLARGEGTRHSDIDLVLIQRTARRFVDRYDGLLSEITQAIAGRDVDLLIYTPEEFAQIRQRRWGVRVVQEGQIIYESQREPT